MSTLDVRTPEVLNLQQQVQSKLQKLRSQVRAQLILEGMARTVVVAVAIACAAGLIDWLLRLGVGVRLFILLSWLIATGYTARKHLLLPMNMKLDPLDILAIVDRHGGFPVGHGVGGAAMALRRVASRVASVLNLPGLIEGQAPPSAAMVLAAIERNRVVLADVEFSGRVDPRRVWKGWSAMGGALLLPLLVIVMNGEMAGLWLSRLFMLSNQPWPQSTYLQIMDLKDGKIIVPRGEAFELRVQIRSDSLIKQLDTVTLYYQEEGRDSRQVPMLAAGADGFRYEFAPIQGDVRATIRGGDDRPDTFTIEPVDRPRVQKLELHSKSPLEKEWQTRSFSGETDLAFLPTTRLRLRIAGTQELSLATLKKLTKTDPILMPLKRIDPSTFEAEWEHTEATQLTLELVAAKSGLASRPTPIAMGLERDRPPTVSLQYSGVRLQVTQRATIPLRIIVNDDHGVKQVDLSMTSEKLTSKEPEVVVKREPKFGPIEEPEKGKEISLRDKLELEPLGLTIGSLVHAEAFGRDASLGGGQEGKSRRVTFQVVTDVELLQIILAAQQSERVKFRLAADQAADIEKLLASLDKQPEGTLARLTAQVRAHERLSEQVRLNLEKLVEEKEWNKLGSPQEFDFVRRRILGPLKRLRDQTMVAQKEDLDKLPGTPTLLGQVQTRQTEIATEMRTILRQMSNWDSFSDVLNQLDEVIKLQTDVKKSTEGMIKKKTDDLFD